MNEEQLTLNVGKFGECLKCPQSGAPVSLQHKKCTWKTQRLQNPCGKI